MAQLLAAGEVDAAATRTSRCSWPAHAEVGRLHGPDLLDVLARLDAELDTVRAPSSGRSRPRSRRPWTWS